MLVSSDEDILEDEALRAIIGWGCGTTAFPVDWR